MKRKNKIDTNSPEYKQGVKDVLSSLQGLLEGYVHTKQGQNLFDFYCIKFGMKPEEVSNGGTDEQ